MTFHPDVASGRAGLGEPLTLNSVTVRYGETTALDDLTLNVDAGEIVAIVGPSGSGKSTLLRSIAGLETIETGQILLGDRDLATVATHRRWVGLMFQDNALFPHLTVADNVAYGLVHGSSRLQPAGRRASGAVESRVAEMLGLVGLEDFGSRPVQGLSGGEAQRVALARALAPEPGLLMLDEPLGSLDRALREELTIELRSLLNELGQTAVHVTHDQGEAFAIADRVAVLIGGSLRRVGPPEKVWLEPGSVEVAQFLGHRNIWSVSVESGQDATILRWGHRTLGEVGPATKAGRYIAVVPEQSLTLARGRAAAIEVVVDRVAFTRQGFEVECHSEGHDDHAWGAAGPRPVWFLAEERLHPGDRVGLSLDLNRLHLLQT